jgi:hypothetical protein
MNDTPFFPSWSPRLNPMGSRLAQSISQLSRLTLGQLERHFSCCLPDTLFPKAVEKANSRDRLYTKPLTFWSFLWQSLNPQTSCREVVRQIQALCVLLGRKSVSGDDGVYCKARARLSAPALLNALHASAQAAQARAAKTTFLESRRVLAVDGAVITLDDTKANRKSYPRVRNGAQNVGFPQMRVVVLFCLASGAILARLCGNKRASESRLFHQLMGHLKAGDIVIADQGFGNYIMVSLLLQLGVDFIARSSRHIPFSKTKGKGTKDQRVVWKRGPNASAILSAKEWRLLPKEQTLRAVAGRIVQKGFRVRKMVLVTTLLDTQKYPAEDILKAYLRRWRLEMCLDDLKTTLNIEQLRCKTPAMVERELLVALIGHNLVRWLMAEVARRHEVNMERVSFKGALDALRQFTQAMSQARSAKRRGELWDQMLQTLAQDLVPERPGRREPRAVKRQHRKYPALSTTRKQFCDRPKRNERRKRKRLRASA